MIHISNGEGKDFIFDSTLDSEVKPSPTQVR